MTRAVFTIPEDADPDVIPVNDTTSPSEDVVAMVRDWLTRERQRRDGEAPTPVITR